MSQLNSSTSSSDPSQRYLLSAGPLIALWMVLGLAVIDLFINVAFAYPSDPKTVDPPRLRLFFEYGRSVEAKLARMTRADPSQTAPITLSGWYEPLAVGEPPAAVAKPVVTFYGMSHTMRLAAALGRVTDRYLGRAVGAPGATTNWSYGAFLRDHGGGESQVVVLSLMSYNLPMITSFSPMIWDQDSPMPYTGDRFHLEGGQLTVVHPPFASFQRFYETFRDPAKWAEAKAVFAKNDPMYDGFVVTSSVLDRSALIRMLRRAYGQSLVRRARSAVLDQTGYQPQSEQIQIARAIVKDFAREARKEHLLPVIFLVNNLGYSDFLYQAIKPALDADDIPYLSSHTVASPDDPRAYLPDSHFTDAVDDKLALALVDLLDRRLKPQAPE